MDNRFYVYAHVKKTDGKCFYIGKGTGSRYKQTSRKNQYWKNIVKKHQFDYIILVNNISEKKAFELESYFCNQIGYKNLSNIRIENGWGGYSNSDETKQKISNSLKGKSKSEEHIKNMKKPKPEGFGENISKKTKGRKIPQHQIEAGIKARSKVTIQYDKQGNFIAEYPSAKYASQSIGICETNMIHHLSGKYKTCRGFIFKYKI